MTVEIYYKYSELDKKYCYGINNVSNPWLWFGIGQVLNKKLASNLYPYLIGEILTTVESDDWHILGKRIAHRINKHYSKITKKDGSKFKTLR